MHITRTAPARTALAVLALTVAAACSGGGSDRVESVRPSDTTASTDPAATAEAPTPVEVSTEVTVPGLTLVNLRSDDEGRTYARELGTARLVRLDPSTGEVVASVEVPGELDVDGRLFYGVAEERLWATIPQSGVLHELDLETLEVGQEIALPTTPAGNYWSHPSEALLVNGYGDDEGIWQVDPGSGEVGSRLASPKADGSIFAFDSVWATNPEEATVTRIDPATGEALATIDVGEVPGEISATAEAVWVSDRADGTVSRIDPGTEEVTAATEVLPGSDDLFVGALVEHADTGWVLVAAGDFSSGGVAAVDLTTGQVLAERLFPGEPGGLQRQGDELVAMVNIGGDSRLLTIDTAQVLAG